MSSHKIENKASGWGLLVGKGGDENPSSYSLRAEGFIFRIYKAHKDLISLNAVLFHLHIK